MNDFLFVLLILGIVSFAGIITKLVEKRDNKNVDSVFENFNNTIKPLEKYQVIKKLFIKSAEHIQKTSHSLNNVESAIYTAELALHIFALWLSNRLNDFESKEQKNYMQGMELESFIICIKEFLNLLIENAIKQKGISNDIIRQIILTRVAFIYQEKNFETRNFDFINLCSIAINYEEDCVFYIGKYEDLRLTGSNPLNMFILPTAYKIGLIDDFLKELASVA